MEAATARSRAEVKKKIRDAERLLRKGGLPADVRSEVERKLKANRMSLEEKVVSVVQRRVAAKYKMVRFFERRKATRAVAKASRSLQAARDTADEDAATTAADQLVAAQADLFYTVNFPVGHKYLALYPSTPDGDPDAPALRERIRASLQDRVRSGDIAEVTAPIDGGDDGIRGLLASVKPAITKLAPKGAGAPAPATPAQPGPGTSPLAGSLKRQQPGRPTPTKPVQAATESGPDAVEAAGLTKREKRPRSEEHQHETDAVGSRSAKRAKGVSAGLGDAGATPTVVAGDDNDDFFAPEPVLAKRRVKEYRVDDGGHHPEQSSRRAWLRQQKEDRSLLAEKGGIIKRQRKEFERGGDLPEDRRSLLAGAKADAKGLHRRFDD